jgi:hypothetical protein
VNYFDRHVKTTSSNKRGADETEVGGTYGPPRTYGPPNL